MIPFNVLVVDDSKVIRDLLEQHVRELGYEVRTAGSGDEAIADLEQQACDLVITDLIMPGINGIELLKWVRRTCEDTEVVIITGHASVETAVEALKAGALDYFHKPFKLAEITHCLRRIAREKELRVTLAAVEHQKEQGVHDLKGIAGRLHRKCFRVEQALRNENEEPASRVKKALEILNS